jgi:hypothetical protein
MANFDAQLQRMQSLMTYGAVKENKKQVNSTMEYHAIGADGKAYGIIRENQKFYIKTADKKNEMLAEAYDYIGGFNNKKQYEYNMLSDAKKNFDMKLMSIKESYSPKTNFSLSDFEVKGDYMSDCGKNMMNEIARQRQIMNNAAAIMNESSTIGCNNTGNPEAPKTMSFTGKAGAPFTETATATLDKDMKETASDPEKQGEPFGDNSKTEQPKDAQYVPKGSVANQKPKGGKVVKVDESTLKVWEMMAKLDKSFTLNEACDEWGSCGLPSSEGVGSPDGHLMEMDMMDDANPVTEEDMMEEPIMEDDEIAGFDDEEGMEFADDSFEFESDDEEGMDPDEFEDEDLDFDFDDEEYDFEDYGDDEDEDVDPDEMEGAEEAEEDMENPDESEIEMLRDEIEDLRAEIAALKGEEGADEEGEFEVELGDEEMPEDDFEGEEGMEYSEDDEMDFSDDEDMDESEMGDETFDPEVDANYDDEDNDFGIDESRKAQLEPIIEGLTRRYIKEDKLNDFGKHPGYRKKPMSLPTTGSDEGDWNDSSVYSEQPFGQKIGDSAPFDKMVSVISDSVMEALTGKKKI